MSIKIQKIIQFLNLTVTQGANFKKEFAKSFVRSNLVLLCPLYAAGEKRKIKYNTHKFC